MLKPSLDITFSSGFNDFRDVLVQQVTRLAIKLLFISIAEITL